MNGHNDYLLSETVLSADLVVNLPKLKTHKKTGVTLALKNMVGINGDKNLLPHHSVGSIAAGGDEYPFTIELVQSEDISPQILGIFIGVPRTQASVTDQMPDLDRIILFKKNLEKICQDREDLIDQIQVTVRHEVGHYLGLDEDDLERLGLA